MVGDQTSEGSNYNVRIKANIENFSYIITTLSKF